MSVSLRNSGNTSRSLEEAEGVAVKEIADRYRGTTSPNGHELRADEKNGEVIIWYLFWGEYEGVDAHHHIGIARIKREGEQYVAGFLRGTEQQPHMTRQYSSIEDLFAELDKEIAKR